MPSEPRLKRAGMHWSVDGANAILALRCSILSAASTTSGNDDTSPVNSTLTNLTCTHTRSLHRMYRKVCQYEARTLSRGLRGRAGTTTAP